MADISYNDFTDTGSWNTTPTQPYNYYNLLSSPVTLPNGDTYITFTNLPVGMTVATAPATTEPFDSIIFYSDYNISDTLIKTGDISLGTIWANYSYVLEGDSTVSTMAAYTDGGYWAYGVPSGSLLTPNVFFTGAGDIDTSPIDIIWTPIESIDDGVIVPFPFRTACLYGVYTYIAQPTANEIFSNYQVINSNTIKILTLDSLMSSEKKLYILFNAP